MRINAGVASSASQLFSLLVRNMFVYNIEGCTVLNVFFGESKINNVDEVCAFAYTHQKIIRFYIAMEYVLLMQKLNSLHHLFAYHQH